MKRIIPLIDKNSSYCQRLAAHLQTRKDFTFQILTEYINSNNLTPNRITFLQQLYEFDVFSYEEILSIINNKNLLIPKTKEKATHSKE